MKKLYLLVLFSFVSVLVFAQEICDNGIDDDGDNLIDCFDPECACDNSFYISETLPACQFMPPVVPSFSLQEVYTTSGANMDARQNLSVGDVDGDGINEIIAHDDESTGELYVFNSLDGMLEATITDAPRMDVFTNSAAIGDADGDGFAEIYVTGSSLEPDLTQQRRVVAFEYDPMAMPPAYVQVMVSATQVGTEADFDRGTPALADFNEDGIPEVYIGNQIWDITTGAEVGNGGVGNSTGASNNNAGTSGNRFEPMSLAADVLPDGACANCSGLELVAGNTVYSVNLGGTPSLNIENSISGSNRNDGLTSIADFDQDGDLDGIIMSQGRIYVWDLQTNNQIGSTYRIPRGNGATGFTNAGGRLNIADFDGDGALEIGTAGRDIYVVVDNDMSLLWSIDAQDGSQKTGSTVFDFEADGISEVVYRDETTLYILSGINGDILSQTPCNSSTRLEYPVVADVNNDGQTEIAVACGGGNGNISVFSSSDQPWVQSRPVWNQHSFHNTQINDDLSFNTEWQDHSLVANGTLNTFLTQATYTTYGGLPLFSAANAMVTLNSVTGANCATVDQYEAEVTITNDATAALGLPAGTPVSFYDGDPFVAGSSYVGTGNTTMNLAPGSSETITVTLTYPVSQFDLYALVNDNGTGTLPLTAPVTNIGECEYGNNLSTMNEVDCSVLPVELSTFSASIVNQQVSLKWTTASETDNDYFDIERSTDGINFYKIGRVAGQGTTDQKTDYEFMDIAPELGGNYYRLRQVDLDGTETYSGIKYVELYTVKSVRLATNPVYNNLKLLFSGYRVGGHYEVYNSIGQIRLSGDLNSDQIDVSEIGKGNHFIKLSIEGRTIVLPFVKY